MDKSRFRNGGLACALALVAGIALMAFRVMVALQAGKTQRVGSLGGEGIFTAILVALFATELMHFLQKHNIGFKLPEQVPPKIRQSFDLLIPIIAIFITLFPLSLWVQAQFGMLLPQAIMAIFAPIISASDSLPAVLVAVLLCHMLWFAGIHGAVIVGGILQAFWLTNLGLNQQALNAGEPITHVFIEPFWQFFIVIGGSGSTMGLVMLYLRSQSAHLRSIGKLSIVPSMFNINEPVIFGSPVVMNPILFIPFICAPLVNAVIAWTATKTNLINHVVALAPLTTPAPIVAAWSTGLDWRVIVFIAVLVALSTLIFSPFFKMFERPLMQPNLVSIASAHPFKA